MDPFTQRMLERARARREKIDSKLADNGQVVTPRKPLAENKLPPSSALRSPSKTLLATANASVKIPEQPKDVLSPQRSKKSLDTSGRRHSKGENSPGKTGILKSPARRVSSDRQADAIASVQFRSPVKKKSRDDKTNKFLVGSPKRNDLREVCVTRTEYVGASQERTSDVSVEINIVHRDDVQIQVQVEERDAPLAVVRRLQQEDRAGQHSDKENGSAARDGRSALRQNAKSRLDRLGVLYSDKSELSSPIHRTESEFTSATPPRTPHQQPAVDQSAAGKRKLARLAALADTINNWEDDTAHHDYKPETSKKADRGHVAAANADRQLDESTLDVSIHSLRDIDRAVHANKAASSAAAAGRLTGSTVAALVST